MLEREPADPETDMEKMRRLEKLKEWRDKISRFQNKKRNEDE
jgi:hypothetical protein